MSPEELKSALNWAETFGKEYNEFKEDLDKMREKVRMMRYDLQLVDKYLKGKVDLK